MPTSAGSGYLLTSDANGVGTWQANSSPQLPTGTEGQTLYNNAGTWASNSGLFYDDTNNRVGIGTTNPQEKIHIGGGIGFDVGLYGVNHYIIQPSSDQLNLGIGYIVNNN